MARERVFDQVLNLRIDERMRAEIKRIAAIDGTPESETARSLIEWGIRAHRAREMALLRLPYGSTSASDRWGREMELEITATWVPVSDPEDM